MNETVCGEYECNGPKTRINSTGGSVSCRVKSAQCVVRWQNQSIAKTKQPICVVSCVKLCGVIQLAFTIANISHKHAIEIQAIDNQQKNFTRCIAHSIHHLSNWIGSKDMTIFTVIQKMCAYFWLKIPKMAKTPPSHRVWIQARACVCVCKRDFYVSNANISMLGHTHHSTKLRENVKSTPFAAMGNNYIWQIIWKFSREKDIWNNRKIHLI